MLHVDFEEAVQEAASAGRTRCLLVEDSRFDRRRLRHLAEQERLDLDIVEASTLREARRHMARQPFDLVLLDNYLPDGEALGALVELRPEEEAEPTPVIMLSGQSSARMRERAIAAGCNDYLDKDGIDGSQFREAVERALSRALERPTAGMVDPAAHLRGVLEAFAVECVDEMRAPVSRMMRHIALARQRHPGAADDLDLLLENCRELFGHLEEIRTHGGNT